MKNIRRYWALPLACILVATACSKEEGSAAADPPGETKEKRKEKKPKPAVSASASAAEPAKPRTPADLTQMKWNEANDRRDLVMTDLGKKCLIRGVQLVLPKDAKFTPLMGQRGCTVRPWGEKGAFFFILSDELPVNLTPREKMKVIPRVIEEDEESWLAEASTGQPKFFSRLIRPIGKHKIYCLANAIDKDLDGARGMLKLCATLEATPQAASQ